MKKTILLAAIMLAALAASTGQNFTLNYDVVTIQHGEGHENQFALGAIQLSKSMVKWQGGHWEDLFYLGSIETDYPGVGRCTRHTWSKVSDVGKVYITLFIKAGTPYQVAVKVDSNVFKMGGHLVRKDSLIYYTDLDEDSVVGVSN